MQDEMLVYCQRKETRQRVEGEAKYCAWSQQITKHYST